MILYRRINCKGRKKYRKFTDLIRSNKLCSATSYLLTQSKINIGLYIEASKILNTISKNSKMTIIFLGEDKNRK